MLLSLIHQPIVFVNTHFHDFNKVPDLSTFWYKRSRACGGGQTASAGHERGGRMGKTERRATVYRRLVDEENEAAGGRAPKGYVPVLVGSEKKMERVLIHTKQFRHPHFAVLLEMAADEFGYEQQGILRIPCDVDYFRQVVDKLSKAK